MKTPVELSKAFGPDFENLLCTFLHQEGLLPDAQALSSPRFLSRSVLPHLSKLSRLFNRLGDDADDAEAGKPSAKLGPYWKNSSNTDNLRLSYVLGFMPPNLYRMASVWSELSRLGFSWPFKDSPLRAVELGAGPAAGAAGIAAAEAITPLGLPKDGGFTLFEKDRATLELGARWSEFYFKNLGFNWDSRAFHKVLAEKPESKHAGLFPKQAGRFQLWLSSFFLNELEVDAPTLARLILRDMNEHLEDEGLFIIVEPALKAQSRRILELRKALIEQSQHPRFEGAVQVLTPCLGHQKCGALADAEDWCHEDVQWWRPNYLRELDKMAGLDRKSLPFTHLVLCKSRKTVAELLPGLKTNPANCFRLVSPAREEGRDWEFYVCGQVGKHRARLAKSVQGDDPDTGKPVRPERGDILQNLQADTESKSYWRLK